MRWEDTRRSRGESRRRRKSGVVFPHRPKTFIWINQKNLTNCPGLISKRWKCIFHLSSAGGWHGKWGGKSRGSQSNAKVAWFHLFSLLPPPNLRSTACPGSSSFVLPAESISRRLWQAWTARRRSLGKGKMADGEGKSLGFAKLAKKPQALSTRPHSLELIAFISSINLFYYSQTVHLHNYERNMDDDLWLCRKLIFSPSFLPAGHV